MDYRNGSISNKLNITPDSLSKLEPGCWLNDEVSKQININFNVYFFR